MRRREKKKTWTTVMMLLPLGGCPLHIFVGSLVDLPVSFSAVETGLICSKDPSTLITTVRSTLSLHHQCQLHTALCGCSRSNDDSSTGPWVSLLSPHPGSPSLCGSEPLHSTSPLPGIFVQDRTLCQGVGGQAMSPRGFTSPAQLQAGSQSGHTSSCHCQPTGFAVWPCQT